MMFTTATSTMVIPILLCVAGLATVGIAGLGIHHKAKGLTYHGILSKVEYFVTKAIPFLNPFSYNLRDFPSYNPFKSPPSKIIRILKVALHFIKFGVACITIYFQLSLTAFAFLLNCAPALLSIVVSLISAFFLYAVVPLFTSMSKKITLSLLGFFFFFLSLSLTLFIYLNVDVKTYDLEEAEAYRKEINERFFEKEKKEPKRKHTYIKRS